MLWKSQAPAALAWCEEITQHLACLCWKKKIGESFEFCALSKMKGTVWSLLQYHWILYESIFLLLAPHNPFFPSSMWNTGRKRTEPRSLSHPMLSPWVQAVWEATCSVAGGWGRLWSVHMDLLYESYGVQNHPITIINCELPLPRLSSFQ